MSLKTFRSPQERAAWEKASRLAEIHWKNMVKRGLGRAMAEAYIRRWAKEGLIEVIRKEGHRKIYGHVGARVSPVEAGKVETPQDAMWLVMNRFATFTPLDLIAMAFSAGIEIELTAARAYCRRLLAADYLRVREQAVQGKREATYQLIKRTGVKAPVYRKISGLLDANTGEFLPNMREGERS